ncbi:hypothetical protein Lalb_Chr12g0198121 [Lupinus albus]|uniref:Uncharacterized protein n=1 Tax=Lupinus albus TaxID=3870 RepID=A0A6A4PLG6_LUPAL|nr:hypothetical protein Lalb_Chr12g0198121 [Lupinus albus]
MGQKLNGRILEVIITSWSICELGFGVKEKKSIFISDHSFFFLIHGFSSLPYFCFL